LISAGVDVRTVAGRLGHGGGGTTTLRVYAAWVSEADQRAATGLLARLPQRPTAAPGSVAPTERAARNPYEVVAAALRSQILSGSLPAGSLMPSRKELAQSYHIAVGTAHRAVALLGEWGLIDIRRGHRAVVVARAAAPADPNPVIGGAPLVDRETESETLVELVLRSRGSEVGRLTAAVTSLSLSLEGLVTVSRGRRATVAMGSALERRGSEHPAKMASP